MASRFVAALHTGHREIVPAAALTLRPELQSTREGKEVL
jgi:hypothetical protein